MRQKMLILSFILLLFLSQTYCEEKPEIIIHYSYFSLKYVFLFGVTLIAVLIRHLSRVYEITIPFNVFLLALGLAWGYGRLYSTWMDHMSIPSPLILYHHYDIIFPALIFAIGFNIELQPFIKCLPQILIISVPASLMASTLHGLLMRQVLDSNNSWSHVDSLLFGIISSNLYPVEIMRRLRETTIMSKYITTLLEGEALLSGVVSVCLFRLLINHRDGWVVYWYQFAMNLVRTILLGLPLGYLFGIIGISLTKLAYNESIDLMLLTIAMCYISFYLGDYIANSGPLANIMTAIMMSRERPSLTRHIDTSITYLWKMIEMIMNGIIYVVIGIETAKQFHNSSLTINHYFVVLVTYLTSNITRFLSFFFFSPILSRLGNGMTFPHMIVYIWGGMKGSLCMHLVLKFIRMEGPTKKADLFFLHTVGPFFLMLLINGSFIPILFKTLGLSVISTLRHLNMNNCMKYIYDARGRMVAILKMDRLLSDANWPLVMSCTALKHPYKKIEENQTIEKLEDNEEEDEEEEEDYFLRYKFTYCPDCQKSLPKEPSKKETKEMMREAKTRLLKHKKMTYSRQYENGMLSREGVRILLQAVQFAMESDDLAIHLEGLLEMFSNENHFHRFMRKNIQSITKTKDQMFKPPRDKKRLLCYRIINNFAYNAVVSIILGIHMVFVSVHFHISYEQSIVFYYTFLAFSLIFSLLYLGEFVGKILSYSWIYLYQDGIRTYFRSCCNILEFIVMLTSFFSFFWHTIYACCNVPFALWYIDLLMNVLLALRICGLAIYGKLPALIKEIGMILVKRFTLEMEKNRAAAYELGKNFIDGEGEILNNLEQTVDNDKIREQLRKMTEEDKLIVTRRLGVAQIEAPWVTTTVKTKTAIRTVLNSIEDEIVELKVSGWVDDVEYNKLRVSLSEKYKEIRMIKYVEPAPPKQIFQEVPFMTDDEEIIRFLHSNVATRKYDPGNTMIHRGMVVPGIYIVITGMFRITFTPDQDITNSIKDAGVMPVIDYVCSNTYDKEVVEYAMPGNTLGALSTITERSYDGVVTAETHSEVFLLGSDVMKRAMIMDRNPVAGLECRIWKFVSFKKAMTILMNLPFYHSYTQEKIKFIIDRSFIPNLSDYKIFVVNDMMQDILLIQGIAIDYNTRDIYTAPCHIPRSVQKLVLPKSSLVNVDIPIETKLMIIPAKDFDEYEIMLAEELVCKLVNQNSTKCLRHYIRQRQINVSDNKMRELRKLLKKTAIRADSDKVGSAVSFIDKISDPSSAHSLKISRGSKALKILSTASFKDK